MKSGKFEYLDTLLPGLKEKVCICLLYVISQVFEYNVVQTYMWSTGILSTRILCQFPRSLFSFLGTNYFQGRAK